MLEGEEVQLKGGGEERGEDEEKIGRGHKGDEIREIIRPPLRDPQRRGAVQRHVELQRVT